jgi:hypothetical protein
MNHSYAIFSELSLTSKPMQPGMNARVFNTTEATFGDGIQLDLQTGIITLEPGTYHITGFSAAVYFTGDEPAEMMWTKSPAAAGYCRLRDADKQMPDSADSNKESIVVGNACAANAVPSLIETFFHVEKRTRIVLEHQCGHDPKGVYLQVYAQNSPWHVFARICIRSI